MNWRTKARIQNAIARLPKRVAYLSYRWLVKSFGRLRAADPTSRTIAGIQMVDYITAAGHSLEGKRVFEVGTGYRLNVPIALWLCGASSIMTCDLNPYLQSDLVMHDLAYIRSRGEAFCTLFGIRAEDEGFKQRFGRFFSIRGSLIELLNLCNITYLAPADAGNLSVEDDSFDFHLSYVVMEHIPPNDLLAILHEGKRVTADSGLFIHRLDMSDHFSHDDKTITKINFLQFSETQWQRLAGNFLMYQNRLRIDEIVALFETAGLEILVADANVDERSLEALEAGFSLDKRFTLNPPRTNATTGVWLVAEKTHQSRKDSDI